MCIDPKTLPDFDVLICGFPCQSFSIVGKREGFADSRGQIIYGLIRILTEKNIPYFILENVKGLVNHNNGKTLHDPGASEVNQLNRIKLMMAVAFENMNRKEIDKPQREDINQVAFNMPSPLRVA